MKKSFPSWRYHSKYEARIIQSEAEESSLGEGWAESPAAFGRDTENAPGAERFIPAQHQKAKAAAASSVDDLSPAVMAPKPKLTRKRAEAQA